MHNKVIRFLGVSALICSMVFAATGCKDNAKEDERSNIGVPSDYVAEQNSSGKLGEILGTSEVMTASCEELYSIAAPTADIITVQGGCIVGDYGYQAFMRRDGGSDQANNHCMILKYDAKTGEVVKQSEILQLNHVNDITYNSRRDCLVVVHNAPFANLLTYINPDTLERIDTFAIDEFIYSIAYNAKRDQYVVGISGGQTFKLLDADFNALTEAFKPSDLTASYTTQGASCDDDYIYFVLADPNAIMVYDWDGNFVTKIDIDMPSSEWETENLTVSNGEICFTLARAAKQTANVFKVTGLTPKETETAETQ